MNAVVRTLPVVDHEPLVAKLAAAVRPEFQTELIRVDPDDPVFARGRCGVAGCDRGAWSRLLCAAHYTRWRNHDRPEMGQFCASAGPIVARAGSQRIDAFDLSRLDRALRLEVAYSIQCRHDDPARGCQMICVGAAIRQHEATGLGRSSYDRQDQRDRRTRQRRCQPAGAGGGRPR